MKSLPLVCPVCDRQALDSGRHGFEFAHAGRRVSVKGLENFVCRSCGADPVFPDQAKRNQVKIADAKRSADGLLSGDAIRAIRETLELSQPEAAALFGGGVNAFSKYERGEVVQSVPMDRFLRVVHAHPSLIDYMRAEFATPRSALPVARTKTPSRSTN